MIRPTGPLPISLLLLATLAMLPAGGVAQQAVTPILEQDSTLNHLVAPPDHPSARLGTLGGITKVGHGPRPMVLIPGLGFGGEVLESFMKGREDHYTMYAVTLPGFGGTAAPVTPDEGTSFGDQTWTRAAEAAVTRLIETENLRNPILVGHWLAGTQIALRVALNHPDRVGAVILLAGSPRWVPPAPGTLPDTLTLAGRVANVDQFLAPRWFKTVTRETWDDNNFKPRDYARHPDLGLRLWREAARPPLHVWVRYLCEFLAQDITLELDHLTVPTLLLRPGLEGLFHAPGQNYLEAYTHRSWLGALSQQDSTITAKTIPDSRIVMWMDQPELVNRAMEEFLGPLQLSR